MEVNPYYHSIKNINSLPDTCLHQHSFRMIWLKKRHGECTVNFAGVMLFRYQYGAVFLGWEVPALLYEPVEKAFYRLLCLVMD